MATSRRRGCLVADGPRVTNIDPDRGKRDVVPTVNVESREHMGSMLELDLEQLDRAFKYRWVNVAPLKVARARAKGYVFVDPNEEDIRNLVGDSPDIADGRVRVGDVILMKCSRNLHRDRRKRVADRTKTRLSGPKRKFKREANVRGVERYGQAVEVITDKEPSGSKE